MFYSFLVILGIILLIYAVVGCHKFSKKIKADIKKKYLTITILIYFFIVGYTVFLVGLIAKLTPDSINNLLISLIFFFGAIFVVIILDINQKLIINLLKNSEDLNLLNSDLNIKNNELKDKTEALLISEAKHKQLSNDLKATLEDFYSLRLHMEPSDSDKNIIEENKKIEEKINKLKI